MAQDNFSEDLQPALGFGGGQGLQAAQAMLREQLSQQQQQQSNGNAGLANLQLPPAASPQVGATRILSNEIKRLQQIEQLTATAGDTTTAASSLLASGLQAQSRVPVSSVFSSYLDQKVPTSFQDLQPGGVMASQQTAMMRQPPLLQDPRLLLPQPSSSMGLAVQQQELPLPSPHSMFHRDGTRRMRGGVIEPFPEKLHRLLSEVEAAGRSDVISFVATGNAFAIHNPEKFFKDIVPLYFRQTRLSSFKRQLNLYGFELISTGPARGGYYHQLFVKDRPELCRRMRRVVVKVGSKKEGEATEKEVVVDPVMSKVSSAPAGEDAGVAKEQKEDIVPPQKDDDLVAATAGSSDEVNAVI